MTDYPVLEVVQSLKGELTTSPIVILQAPPGAGKSTVLPLQLMDEPWLQNKKIIMLEPRRLAARSVAQRMSQLLNRDLGQTVGYRVRFDTMVSGQTKIEVVTEGILTRMLQQDNSLEDVGLVLFDEFHERSLQADLALALTLQAQQVLRPDLRIVIMSATLDAEQLVKALGNVPVITSVGRQYPVTIHYAPQETDASPVVKTLTAIRRALHHEDGDILVFLPGAGEIKRVQELLEEDSVEAVVYPLYGDLSFQKQQEAILPRKDGKRKIVLATSIAETSLTIEGIKVVIDVGLSRVPRFDPRSGLSGLQTVRVSKDAADQRSGRAGRLGPGVCYRLWTVGTHAALLPARTPEIVEADLSSLLLELMQWGIKDVNELTWITTPPAGTVSQARELLLQLDAITASGITSRGKEMLMLPTHPRIAHLLLEAEERATNSGQKDHLNTATDIAALLEERDPLPREAGADVALRIQALQQYRAGEKVNADRNALERIERLASHWRRLFRCKEHHDDTKNENVIGELLMAAYPERIAKQQSKFSERYKLANGRIANLPKHDPLINEPWLCVANLDAGAGEGKIFLAAAVDGKALLKLAKTERIVRWDESREMVVALQEKRFGNLVIESIPAPNIPEDQAINTIIKQFANEGLRFLGNEDAIHRFQSRVLSLHHWRPDEEWPEVTDQLLIEQAHQWLAPFLNSITKRAELLKLDMIAALNSILPYEKYTRIDVLAPLRIQVPSGSWINVQYSKEGSAPVIEVRLQELFGLVETPTVNEGRTKVLLHLLSPGYKPVQVTQDLKSFWHTTYHEVRKELRLRYPKHHWPEDPWTAEAVRGVKRRSS